MLIYKENDNIVMGKMVLENNSGLQKNYMFKVIGADGLSNEDFFQPRYEEDFYNIGRHNCEAWSYYSNLYKDIELDIAGGKLGYDFKNRRVYCYEYNNGYNDAVRVFEMLYPNIVELYFKGCASFRGEEFNDKFFDMTKLIGADIRNLPIVAQMIDSGNYIVWKHLEKYFPEFYFFFSRIVPFVKLEDIDSFSKGEIQEVKSELINSDSGIVLGDKVSTTINDIRELQGFLSSAEQTTKVLGAVKLLKR